MCPLSHGRAPRDRTNSRRLYCQRTGQGVLARFPRFSLICAPLGPALAVSRSGRQVPAGYTGSRVSIMVTTLTTVGPFVNEPITDYRQPENVRGMRQAIAKVRAQLGREYDLVIGGQHIRTKDKIVSINPANPSEVIGIHQKATLEHVE